MGILRTLQNQYQGTIDTMFCNQETIASVLPQTDMVLNCVKWPKERTDFLTHQGDAQADGARLRSGGYLQR